MVLNIIKLRMRLRQSRWKRRVRFCTKEMNMGERRNVNLFLYNNPPVYVRAELLHSWHWLISSSAQNKTHFQALEQYSERLQIPTSMTPPFRVKPRWNAKKCIILRKTRRLSEIQCMHVHSKFHWGKDNCKDISLRSFSVCKIKIQFIQIIYK